ncbi:predicted protein [Arabidopsis lyrata subsp. lyrata]|uniref:Predicted protein n=1 Tax=Arabidopsis lyrata subsp. lyrata TaxID=81972 RepID=D7MR21_ARALL|nr:predicted protein [Arabidopsis lyrata subsp. lyrata]
MAKALQRRKAQLQNMKPPETRRKNQNDSAPVDHRSQRHQTLDLAKSRLTTSWPHQRNKIVGGRFRKLVSPTRRFDGYESRPSNPSRLGLSSLFHLRENPESLGRQVSIRTVGTPGPADLKDGGSPSTFKSDPRISHQGSKTLR